MGKFICATAWSRLQLYNTSKPTENYSGFDRRLNFGYVVHSGGLVVGRITLNDTAVDSLLIFVDVNSVYLTVGKFALCSGHRSYNDKQRGPGKEQKNVTSFENCSLL